MLRDANDPLDTDAELFTGHVDLSFDGTYDRSADIYITQDEPLPFNLLGIGIFGQNVFPNEAVTTEQASENVYIPMTKDKRALSMLVNMNNSIQGDYGVSEDDLFGIDDDNEDLFTGTKDLPMNGGYDKTIDVYIEQDQPLPMNVIGLGVRVGG